MFEFSGNRIQSTALSLDALLADSARTDCGALAVFAGTVRDQHQGRAVTQLNYSAYAPLAERMIRDIEREVAQRHGVAVCRAVHRIGPLKIGESAIVAVVRSGHRAEAFAALRALVDEVKHRVPIWKEEFYADGSSAYVSGCCIGDAVPEASLPCPPLATARRHSCATAAFGHDDEAHDSERLLLAEESW